MKIIITILLLNSFFYCKSIDKSSSSDDIIDYAAKKIATDILYNYKEKDKNTIGVATFSKEELENNKINTLGLFLANSIHNEMFNPQRYDLVERTQIDKLVEEFKSYQNGLYSESDTKKLALHGVDFLLIGSLQKRQNTIRINARLVSVQTGKIVSIASETIPVNDSIIELYNLETGIKNNEREEFGSLNLNRKMDNKFTKANHFFLDDEVFLNYNQRTPLNLSKMEIGFSKCLGEMYLKKTIIINSHLKQIVYPIERDLLLNEFLTGNNKVELPDSNCYNISLIGNNKIIKTLTINIEKRKFLNSKYY